MSEVAEMSCTGCPKVFSNKLEWKNHMLQEHNILVFTCDLCPKVFYEKEDLFIEHFDREHRPDCNRHVCDICGVSYKWFKFLNKHIKDKHQIEKMTECPKCGEEFYNSIAFKKHLKLKHEGGGSWTFHKCPKCYRSFTGKEWLLLHDRVDHSWNSDRAFKKYAMCYLTNMSEDVVLKDSKRCVKCNLKFSSSVYLVKHIKTMHCKPKYYQCCVCNDALYATRAGLGIHFLYDHGMSRLHKCTKCNTPKSKIAMNKIQSKTIMDKKQLKIEAKKQEHAPPEWSKKYVKKNLPNDLDLVDATDEEVGNLKTNVKQLFHVLATVPPSKLKGSQVIDPNFQFYSPRKRLAFEFRRDCLRREEALAQLFQPMVIKTEIDIVPEETENTVDKNIAGNILENNLRKRKSTMSRVKNNKIKETYECNYCGNKFPAKSEIIGHVANCCIEVSNITNDVTTNSKTTDNVNENLSENKPRKRKGPSVSIGEKKKIKKSYECNNCNSKFSLKSEIIDHLEKCCIEVIITNEVITNEFTSNEVITNEVTISNEFITNEVTTNSNQAMSDVVESIVQENNGVDNDTEKYECDLCKAEFSEISLLYEHTTLCKINEELEKMFDFSESDKPSNQEEESNRMLIDKSRHEKLPKKTKKYECDECQTKFTSRSEIIQHLPVHHTQVSNHNESDVSSENVLFDVELEVKSLSDNEATGVDIEIYTCAVCNTEFVKQSLLLDHMKLCKPIDRVFTITYTCNKCDQSFHQVDALKEHYKIHKNANENINSMTCNICQKSFKDKRALRMHKFRGHNIKNNQCNNCKGPFDELDGHVCSESNDDNTNTSNEKENAVTVTKNDAKIAKTALNDHLPKVMHLRKRNKDKKHDKQVQENEHGQERHDLLNYLKLNKIVSLKNNNVDISKSNNEASVITPPVDNETAYNGNLTQVLQGKLICSQNNNTNINKCSNGKTVIIPPNNEMIINGDITQALQDEIVYSENNYTDINKYNGVTVTISSEDNVTNNDGDVSQVLQDKIVHDQNSTDINKCNNGVTRISASEDNVITHNGGVSQVLQHKIVCSKNNNTDSNKSIIEETVIVPPVDNETTNNCDVKQVIQDKENIVNDTYDEPDEEVSVNIIKETDFTRTKPDNRRHSEKIKLKRLYKCLKCEDKFTERRLLMNHIRNKHNIPLNKLFKCTQCTAVFKMEDKLKQHIKLKHTKEDKPKTPVITIKKANMTKIPILFSNMISNKLMNNTMHSCEICFSCFPTIDLLQKHIQWEHTKNVSLHKCGKCGEVLYSVVDLDIHMETHKRSPNNKSLDANKWQNLDELMIKDYEARKSK